MGLETGDIAAIERTKAAAPEAAKNIADEVRQVHQRQSHQVDDLTAETHGVRNRQA